MGLQYLLARHGSIRYFSVSDTGLTGGGPLLLSVVFQRTLPMKSGSGQRVPSYKEVTIHQLRSLIETAQQGNQVAAAKKLGLAQATIWEQLHALQREVGATLLETNGRGCRLTPDGELLVKLAAPIVSSFYDLPNRFQQLRGAVRQRLSIAATPRILAEDLSACILEFELRFPAVELGLMEVDDDQVWKLVQDGKVQLGFTPQFVSQAAGKWLDFSPGYEVDQYLVTPADHPLAKRRVVRPEDILAYPLVNGPGTFYGERMLALATQIEAGDAPARHIAAYTVSTIRKFVKLGFGIGIVPRHSSTADGDAELHERSMSKYLGRIQTNTVRRRGVSNELAESFIQIVRHTLNHSG